MQRPLQPGERLAKRRAEFGFVRRAWLLSQMIQQPPLAWRFFQPGGVEGPPGLREAPAGGLDMVEGLFFSESGRQGVENHLTHGVVVIAPGPEDPFKLRRVKHRLVIHEPDDRLEFVRRIFTPRLALEDDADRLPPAAERDQHPPAGAGLLPDRCRQEIIERASERGGDRHLGDAAGFGHGRPGGVGGAGAGRAALLWRGLAAGRPRGFGRLGAPPGPVAGRGIFTGRGQDDQDNTHITGHEPERAEVG